MKNNIKAIFFVATIFFSANLFAQVNHTINISDFNDPYLLRNNLPAQPFNLIINGTGAIPDYTWNVVSPFYNNKNIISVVGNDLTVIGDEAFGDCRSLETIDFPNAITVGKGAFWSCHSLQAADFPNVTSIVNYAFAYCYSLQAADFPNATTIERSAFYGCISLQAVDFSNATIIGDFVFSGCYSLKTVDLPNIITVGHAAFESCDSLEAISLGTAFTEPTEISVVGSSEVYPSFDETNTENICLTLGENVLPKADGNLWNTYYWKCIESSIKEPSQLTSSQIYPNPASDKTTLSLEVASTCNIQIVLSDILGQEVMQLYEGLVAAGSFTRSFNTSKLAKGIYFVKIIIGSEYKLEKLVVK